MATERGPSNQAIRFSQVRQSRPPGPTASSAAVWPGNVVQGHEVLRLTAPALATLDEPVALAELAVVAAGRAASETGHAGGDQHHAENDPHPACCDPQPRQPGHRPKSSRTAAGAARLYDGVDVGREGTVVELCRIVMRARRRRSRGPGAGWCWSCGRWGVRCRIAEGYAPRLAIGG
jgi:hypothetical protein